MCTKPRQGLADRRLRCTQRLRNAREVSFTKNKTQHAQMMEADVVIIQHRNDLNA